MVLDFPDLLFAQVCDENILKMETQIVIEEQFPLETSLHSKGFITSAKEMMCSSGFYMKKLLNQFFILLRAGAFKIFQRIKII